MQELAGLSNNNVNDLIVETIVEYYLHTNYYSKGILKENLSKGFIEKLKNKVKKLNLSPAGGLLASLLSSVKSTLNPKIYQLYSNIIEKYKGSINNEDIDKYLEEKFTKLIPESVDEGILDIFRNKKTGEANVLSKSISTLLLAAKLAILINSTNPGIYNQVKQAVNDNDIPKIEKVSDAPSVISDLGGSEKNIKLTGDLLKSTIPINTVSIEDGGKTIKVGFDTGEFKVSDEDGTAKKIADQIIKQAGGKNIKSLTLSVKGLISNTPGAGDDDPNGPGEKGLGDDRLEAGKNLAQKVSSLIKVQSPGAEVKIVDDGTNVDNPGDEVAKNSDAAKKNQAFSFFIKNLQTDEKIPVKAPSSPEDAGYLRNPKKVYDGDELYTILGYILPLIMKDEDYNNFKEKLTSALNAKAKETKEDFTIKKDNLKILKNESTDENFKKILEWVIAAEDGKSIGVFINSLDDSKNINVGKPGENPRGSGKTQINIPGPLPGETNVLGETSLVNIYNSLLTEAPTLGFIEDNIAKGNLGMLVPLYCYIWGAPDNGAIDYITKNDQYKTSWNTFKNDFGVIASKFEEKIPNKKSKDQKQEPGKQPTSSSDKTKTQIQPDVTRVTQAINRDTTFKSYLNRIDNKDELANFILALFLYRDTKGDSIFPPDQTFADNTGRVRSALFTLNNTIPNNLTEANVQQIFTKFPDVKTAYTHIGRSSILRNELRKINNITEFTQFIIYSILPYINPKFRTKNGVQVLKSAIALAANMSTQYKDILDKKYKKTLQ
jgi:hypothetical protein